MNCVTDFMLIVQMDCVNLSLTWCCFNAWIMLILILGIIRIIIFGGDEQNLLSQALQATPVGL